MGEYMRFISFLAKTKTRFYLYGVVVASLPIFVTVGVMSDELSNRAIALISAIFGVSTGVTSMVESVTVPNHTDDYNQEDNQEDRG